jgi:transposase
MNKGSTEMLLGFSGIDISKDKLDLGLLRDAGKVKSKVLKHHRDHFPSVKSWICKQTGLMPEQILITLEPTGLYHEALVYYLHEAGFQLLLANPAQAHKYAQSLGKVHKTDKSDALILARYGMAQYESGTLSLWQPEAPEARQLKVLLRRLSALEKDLQREQNRLEACGHSDTSARVIESIENMIKVLKDEIKRLEKEIDDHIDAHPHLKENRELLESIKGIGQVMSREMVSLFACKQFESASQLAAFVGVIPKIKESGAFRGRSMLSKCGPGRLRAKLYMAAIVASNHNPHIRQQRERLLLRGKTKMQALGAAMRKLLHICFGVIKHQQAYQPQAG